MAATSVWPPTALVTQFTVHASCRMILCMSMWEYQCSVHSCSWKHMWEYVCVCVCVFVSVFSAAERQDEIKADNWAAEESGISLIDQSDKDYSTGVCPARLMSRLISGIMLHYDADLLHTQLHGPDYSLTQVESSVDGNMYAAPLVEAETPPSLLHQHGVTTPGILAPHLITACVKWLSSIALHCHSALQPAMDGIHLAFCWSSAETADGLSPTQLFYWSPPRPLCCPQRQNTGPDITDLGWGQRQSEDRAGQTYWMQGISVEVIDCVWVQR